MNQSTAPLSFALLTLSGHMPAPARVAIVRIPLFQRAGLSLISGLAFWSLALLLLMLPPHFPYFLGPLALGVFFPYHFWTGRYRVRAFAGICPRCGHHLQLAPQTRIKLPAVVTCFACHFEPRLQVLAQAPGEGTHSVWHWSPECAGRWERMWLADEQLVVCSTCRAYFPASREVRAAADEENDRSDLMGNLADEGRFL